jgi:hypothetical protein
MNDNDLERSLRTQRGPREDGYQPSALPMTLDEHRSATGARPSRLGRAGLFVGVAAAGALAVAAVAIVLSGPGAGPEVGAGSASPTAGASEATTRCGARDLVLSAEPWGGAAGSRGTIVTIALASGRYDCLLPTRLIVRVADASGAVLANSESPSSSGSVVLDADTSFVVRVTWSNWCGADPVRPISLAVLIGLSGWSSPVSVPAGADPVPPCNGGATTTLSVSEVEAAPY